MKNDPEHRSGSFYVLGDSAGGSFGRGGGNEKVGIPSNAGAMEYMGKNRDSPEGVR